jgi:putative redox protein
MSEPDSITTVTIGREKYATTVVSSNHTFVADEPGELGGADTGPSPYDLLLASLGACKAITVRMYADRKGWDVEEIRLDLAHSRPEGRGGPERIDVSLSITGDLDDEQRARLKEIAGKCPVERTISGELSVHTFLEG